MLCILNEFFDNGLHLPSELLATPQPVEQAPQPAEPAPQQAEPAQPPQEQKPAAEAQKPDASQTQEQKPQSVNVGAHVNQIAGLVPKIPNVPTLQDRPYSMDELVDLKNPNPRNFLDVNGHIRYNNQLMSRIRAASQEELGVSDPRNSWWRFMPFSDTRALAQKMDDLEHFNREMTNDPPLWNNMYRGEEYQPGFGSVKNHLADNWGKYLLGAAALGVVGNDVLKKQREKNNQQLGYNRNNQGRY